MIIDQLPELTLPVDEADELAIERGQLLFKVKAGDLIPPGIQEDIEQLQTDVDNLENGKQDTLVSGTNIKTINGVSVLGSGDIEISGGGGGLWFTNVPISATTGDIATISNSEITADFVLARIEWANPSAITTDVTWTTSAGSFVLNGTCSTATTANVLLILKNN